MPYVHDEKRFLHYQMVDLTPPWIKEPETVILHQGVGTTSLIWSEWIPVLASHYRVVYFDLRGFGNSKGPGADFVWSLDSFSDDVLAIADAVSASRFHLIGESFGGTVTLNTVVRHPGRVITSTAVSAPHRGAPITVLSSWKELVSRPGGMEEWSERLMDYRFTPGAISDAARTWFKQVQDSSDSGFVAKVSQLVLSTDLRPMLNGVTTPTLLLATDSSPFVEAELVSELHSLLRCSELQIFANTRHGLAFSHARACSELFLGFAARARDGKVLLKK